MNKPSFDYKKYYNNKAEEIDEISLTYRNPIPYKRYFYLKRFQEIMKVLNPKKNEKILDIGCGIGYYTNALINKGAIVTATEISITYLNQAKKLSKKKGAYVLCDATKLPFRANSFDKILMTEVIEHIANHEQCIKEIQRVLKPEGVLIITTPSKFSPMNLAYSLKRIIKRYDFNEHIHEFKPSEFKNLVGKYLRVEKLIFTNYLVPYPLDYFFTKDKKGVLLPFIKNFEYLLEHLPLVNNLGWTMILKAFKN